MGYRKYWLFSLNRPMEAASHPADFVLFETAGRAGVGAILQSSDQSNTSSSVVNCESIGAG